MIYKNYLTLPYLLVMIIMLGSCKTKSHEESHEELAELSHHDQVSLAEKVGNLDCFVQKVYLLTTLWDMIWSHDRSSGYHVTPVSRILHPTVAKQIIDTVMAREDPSCSPNVLYGPTCDVIMKNNRRTSAYFFYGGVPKSWWWNVFQIQLTGSMGKKIDRLLTNHFFDFQGNRDPRVRFQHMNCFGICLMGSDRKEPEVTYEYNNNFGLCMLRKHAHYLKSKNVFDLNEYFDFERNHIGVREFDVSSLQSFIDRTQKPQTFEEEAL